MKRKKSLVGKGKWVSFEFAKDRYKFEPSQIKHPSCINWEKGCYFLE